jgi:hypothetical protein
MHLSLMFAAMLAPALAQIDSIPTLIAVRLNANQCLLLELSSELTGRNSRLHQRMLSRPPLLPCPLPATRTSQISSSRRPTRLGWSLVCHHCQPVSATCRPSHRNPPWSHHSLLSSLRSQQVSPRAVSDLTRRKPLTHSQWQLFPRRFRLV